MEVEVDGFRCKNSQENVEDQQNNIIVAICGVCRMSYVRENFDISNKNDVLICYSCRPYISNLKNPSSTNISGKSPLVERCNSGENMGKLSVGVTVSWVSFH